MKSIESLVSEAARDWRHRYVNMTSTEDHLCDQAFKAGAHFATDLVFERMVKVLRSHPDYTIDYYKAHNWADWLEANRSDILGIKGEVNEGGKMNFYCWQCGINYQGSKECPFCGEFNK